jgi:hypothetical protein
MKYFYWTFLGIIVVAGLVVSIYFGLQPKSVPKIKSSLVADPERMGQAVAQRLWGEIKDAPIVFLGVDPDQPDDLRVWKGFLDSLPADEKYALIVIDPALPGKNIIPYNEQIDIQKETERFKQGIHGALENKVRVAVIVPSIYSSQSIHDSPVNRLKAELSFLPMSLSIAQPTLQREEEASAPYPCATGSGDTVGLGSWGCLIRTKSRSLYHKNWEGGKYLGLMDQIGANDYLILLRFIPKT